MRALSLAQIAEMTNGRAKGAGQVDNVVIDSRRARAGSLFLPYLASVSMGTNSWQMSWP